MSGNPNISAFDPSRPFCTRDGITVDGLRETRSGFIGRLGLNQVKWKRDGSFRDDGRRSGCDLINIDPAPATPATTDAGKASTCLTPGCCTCDLPRCPKCGYTRHDAAHLMDHQFCDGVIPDAVHAEVERMARIALAAFTGHPKAWEEHPDGHAVWLRTARGILAALATHPVPEASAAPDEAGESDAAFFLELAAQVVHGSSGRIERIAEAAETLQVAFARRATQLPQPADARVAALELALGFGTEHDAGNNLEGALIDLDRLGVDAVCRETLERVRQQLAKVSLALAKAPRS